MLWVCCGCVGENVCVCVCACVRVWMCESVDVDADGWRGRRMKRGEGGGGDGGAVRGCGAKVAVAIGNDGGVDGRAEERLVDEGWWRAGGVGERGREGEGCMRVGMGRGRDDGGRPTPFL